MVKIINGEIVQDNDPRLRNINSSSTGNRREANMSGNSRVTDLFSDNNPPQTPNNPNYGQRSHPLSPTASPQHQTNPLDMLAQYLHLDDRIITIPPIPQLGFTESKIGLIYFLALGVLCLIFGMRTLLFGVFAYALYKSSEKK